MNTGVGASFYGERPSVEWVEWLVGVRRASGSTDEQLAVYRADLIVKYWLDRPPPPGSLAELVRSGLSDDEIVAVLVREGGLDEFSAMKSIAAERGWYAELDARGIDESRTE